MFGEYKYNGTTIGIRDVSLIDLLTFRNMMEKVTALLQRGTDLALQEEIDLALVINGIDRVLQERKDPAPLLLEEQDLVLQEERKNDLDPQRKIEAL